MLRWVISPVIGTGTRTDSYRPYAEKYAYSWLGVSNADWYFMLVKAEDFTAAEADPNIIVIPMRQMADDLSGAERTWLGTQLQAHGLPYAWLQSPQTMRQALLTMARWVEPTFDTNWFRTL